MTTHIFNPQNICVSEGRNLGIMLRHAKKRGGVARITIDKLVGYRRDEALVNVFYNDGFRAVTNFSSYDHAIDWAQTRSKASPHTSWFAGCVVDFNLFRDFKENQS